MRVGINLTNLYPGKIGGAEQYVRNVIREMGNDGETVSYLFVNSTAFSTFKSDDNCLILKINDFEDRDTQMNFYIDFYQMDILFCPLFFVAPENCSIPAVPSILDVQHEFFPQYFDKKILKNIRINTRTTLQKAEGIITISEYSKRTIIDKYKIPDKKIKVTHLCSDGCFEQKRDDNKQKEIKERIGADYIFYPANTWPHKNHINLLKAYSILKENYHTELKLVLTGDGKQQTKQIAHYISENKLEDDIHYLGYVHQNEMPYIFANATVLAFPSVFEGFGIPLVEAMKAEVAIACSNCGSIPEVAGDAAIYFDAYSPEDIAEKISMLENNSELRNELIEKGKIQAQKFSWEKCAKETVSYLKKIKNVHKKKNKYKYEQDYPLVTIVTPSFNQGEFIKETIESVLNQDYPNIEYIVMDGGSTDNTVEILKSYGDRIKWVSEKDNGQADAVNKGIRRANGSIIGWLNSDDTYLEGAVRKMVKYLKTHTDTDMVYGEGYYIDKNGNITERYLTEKFNRTRLGEQCIICQPTAFFTKQIIEEVGMLDAEHQLSMDYELWMRIAKAGKVAYIPEYVATSRMYEENKTLSRRDEVFEETIRAVKKHYGYVPITWINGYADYLCKGSRGKDYQRKNKILFTKYNISNPRFLFSKYSKYFMAKYSRVKNWLSALRSAKEDAFTGKYVDGWLAKIYRTEVEEADNVQKIIIKGNHVWPLKKELVISCYLGGKLIGIEKIDSLGEFERTILLNKRILQKNAELELCMNKIFCPAKMSKSEDTRCLSFILRDLEIIRGE